MIPPFFKNIFSRVPLLEISLFKENFQEVHPLSLYKWGGDVQLK